MARGEWVNYNGKKVPPIYTPKHSTIIETLRLTDDEIMQLDVIISEDIRKDRTKARDKERKKVQRREAGAVDRETYNSNRLLASTDKKVMAIELVVNLGKTTREAAGVLGVSAMTVSRWTK
jgi:DNA-directed RNA polymerase specialized sigma subunit